MSFIESAVQVFLGVVAGALLTILLVMAGIVALHLRRRQAVKALVAAGAVNKENSSNATHMHTLYETVRQHDDDGQTYIYGESQMFLFRELKVLLTHQDAVQHKLPNI